MGRGRRTQKVSKGEGGEVTRRTRGRIKLSRKTEELHVSPKSVQLPEENTGKALGRWTWQHLLAMTPKAQAAEVHRWHPSNLKPYT